MITPHQDTTEEVMAKMFKDMADAERRLYLKLTAELAVVIFIAFVVVVLLLDGLP
jgi:hypothetical protein